MYINVSVVYKIYYRLGGFQQLISIAIITDQYEKRSKYGYMFHFAVMLDKVNYLQDL